MRVLIADDEAVSRVRLRNTLTRLGHEVVEATDGRMAWECFQREETPLLIVDWMMPQINGLELCRMIRAERRQKYTYIMMLTALGGKGSYLEGMRAGADDFITKPFDQEELDARLHVAARILDLQAEVKRLEGLLPICTYCKRIRDEEGVWTKVESYIARRTDASFSHGICPCCYEARIRPELSMMKQSQLPDEGRASTGAEVPVKEATS
jgi:DNA-binding response OmpR family regulator